MKPLTSAINLPDGPDQSWPLLLFNKSVLKQKKLQEITSYLGTPRNLICLDIGGDNGVISYLLRQRGGKWKSADLDEPSVLAIKELVQSEVYQIDGRQTPFRNDEFDRIVIVDFLEHIPDDTGFIKELYRIMKPGGILIINVPHIKNSLLRKFRLAIGQTDEKHGHLRPGYTIETINNLLGDRFILESHRTYSKFFSELIDTLMNAAIAILKNGKGEGSKKGTIVTGDHLSQNWGIFRAYSFTYPMVWLFSRLDLFAYRTSGYMLITKARINKA